MGSIRTQCSVSNQGTLDKPQSTNNLQNNSIAEGKVGFLKHEERFTQSIYINKKLQGLIVRTFTPQLWGMCSVVTVPLIVDATSGAMSDDAQMVAASLVAALGFYRQYSISNGVSEQQLDKYFELYANQAKSNGRQPPASNVRECVEANNRWILEGAKK